MKNVQEWAILDSGATSHSLVSAAPMSNVQQTMTPLTVKLPDGVYIKSSATCRLALVPGLPSKAREAHITPDLTSFTIVCRPFVQCQM